MHCSLLYKLKIEVHWMFAVRIIQKFLEKYWNSGNCEAEFITCDCLTLFSLNTPKDHISFTAWKLRITEMLS